MTLWCNTVSVIDASEQNRVHGPLLCRSQLKSIVDVGLWFILTQILKRKEERIGYAKLTAWRSKYVIWRSGSVKEPTICRSHWYHKNVVTNPISSINSKRTLIALRKLPIFLVFVNYILVSQTISNIKGTNGLKKDMWDCPCLI